MLKNFAITGIAGYVAPRNLKAIKDTKKKSFWLVGILKNQYQGIVIHSWRKVFEIFKIF